MGFSSLPDRDAVINQLCSVVVPFLFLNVGLLSLFGGKIASQLLKQDSHSEKNIKPRKYGLVKMIGMILFFIMLLVYFFCYRIWDLFAFILMILLGYAWIKFRIYSSRLEYTYRYLVFSTGKKREIFPWKDVVEMSWRTPRGSIMYSLKIRFRSGQTANISSNDFVGLVKLKTFFDENFYKM